MELIPILSLIILVATITTFILSIGAYAMYKVRERKGEGKSAETPSTIEAELLTPSRLAQDASRSYSSRLTREVYQTGVRDGASSGAGRQVPYAPAMTNAYTAERYVPEESSEREHSRGNGAQSRDQKYMRYTHDGYIEPGRDKNSKEDNLRWR